MSISFALSLYMYLYMKFFLFFIVNSYDFEFIKICEFDLYYYDRKSDVLHNRELAVLRGFPNVTVTHHMAFYTDECVKTVVRDSLEGCKIFMEGNTNPDGSGEGKQRKNPWEVV